MRKLLDLSRNRAFFAVFAILILATVPFFAHADIISFMSNALGDSSTPASAVMSASTSENSQKMALLEAPTNSNPQPEKNSLDTSIVNGSALTSEDTNSLEDASSTILSANSEYGDQISLYTVHPGDTLSETSRAFDPIWVEKG